MSADDDADGGDDDDDDDGDGDVEVDEKDIVDQQRGSVAVFEASVARGEGKFCTATCL